MSHFDFDWKFEIPTWEKIWERLLDLINQIRAGVKTVEEASDTLVRHGLDAGLIERFLGEILEGQA